MNIRLTMVGVMKNVLATDHIDLVLKEHATLADLYEGIAEVAENTPPSAIWNRQKKRFRGPIIVRSGSRILKDESTPLHDGQEIEIKRFLIGG